ncbi:methyl-accepting chemotaxis protein [Aestuariibacter halophilus]|uniref:Methyl-accepting chemotaxis protein n=1 Tax=Fluctibacter halophilus TaxID=226011 RepID=A0ABS8GBD5_9ALTE|nr:methyl-accepting chemotaxis protein [Aestuariibacter halophilus]MCC2617818.1 methyl-accepting chemotaxis protein [Aestuariibacter halophilus]
MKITVAMRVIGGFAIISLLLIIISAFSLLNLNSIGSATQEVNNLAIPTVNGSNQLKVSFLNMGRLTVEGFHEKELEQLQVTLDKFQTSKTNFDKELSALRNVVGSDASFSGTLATVDGIYKEYLDNVTEMFDSRRTDLEYGSALDSVVGDVEDNADDASTLILDFADLPAVSSDSRLRQASEIGSRLETSLLSLLTVSADYIKTQNLIRAETIGNEVKLVVNQIAEQLSEMQQLAAGRDNSGTMEEISELVTSVINMVNASDGLLATQVDRLNKQIQARQALTDSETNIQQAIESLNKLLALTDEKTATIKEDVESSVSSGNVQVIVIVIISLGAAVAIGFFSVRAIVVPLSKVNDVLHVVSSGDLTKKLDDTSDDEFGELARSVNNLIDSLKQLISGITSRAAQLAAASEETSAVTAQTTDSIQNQKSQVAQVATATTEMHSTSQMVTQSAEDTLAQISHADDEAEKVKAISLENKRTIEVLARDVEEAANVINKLHQDSASIGGILDVIRGVADQTNLLALNAAIEAARAGEQGRGFAVVADEVRTLASRTQESTQEINAMIEVLQAGAEKAVTVMNQGKEQTTLCVEQTEKATLALDLITEAVHRAHDVSSQIEQSAREQNVVSQEISEKLENIVGIAEETAIGAQQTSDSSQEVARLAEELQLSIQQFKV